VRPDQRHSLLLGEVRGHLALFVRQQISKSLILALVTHNPIVPLLNLYIVAIYCRENSLTILTSTNGYLIRRTAVDHNIPLITNLQLAKRFVKSLSEKKAEDLKIISWDEY